MTELNRKSMKVVLLMMCRSLSPIIIQKSTREKGEPRSWMDCANFKLQVTSMQLVLLLSFGSVLAFHKK